MLWHRGINIYITKDFLINATLNINAVNSIDRVLMVAVVEILIVEKNPHGGNIYRKNNLNKSFATNLYSGLLKSYFAREKLQVSYTFDLNLDISASPCNYFYFC